MSAVQAPLIFGTSPALHGMLTTPVGVPPRGQGVVVCPPFGYQNLCTHRPLRTLAQRLSRAGWPVLRFDWPGSGDSDDRVPRAADEGVTRWTDAVRDAVGAVRSSAGVEDVVLVGLGIGGTLAACSAIDSPVSGLVLLSPYVSGAAYLRELRAFEGMAAKGAADATLGPGSVTSGLEASGFLVTDAEATAIAAVDLATLDLSPLADRHVLLATSQRDRATGTLADRLREARADVRQAIVPELASAWEEPHLCALPPPCSEIVLDWLESLPASGGPAQAAAPILGSPVMTLATGVREETIALDGARGQLVGVTSEPSDGKGDGDAWLVFLNAGGIRRSGPARLWTTLARAWAQRGLRALRLDLSGIGDSDGDLAQDELPSQEVGRLYVTDFSDDVREGLRWIQTRGTNPRVALLVLCSGAYWSLHSALTETGVRTVVLVNPAVLFWDEHVPSVRALGLARRVVRSPRRWHRVLGRGARVHGRDLIRGAVLKARGRVAESWHGRSIRAALEHLSEDGISTLMVFSAGDSGLLYLEQHLGTGYRSELERYGVTVEVIPGADHIFRPLRTHDLLRAAIERHLERTGFLPAVPAPGIRTS